MKKFLFFLWTLAIFIFYPFLKPFDKRIWWKVDYKNYFAELFILVLFFWLLWTWFQVIPYFYESFINKKDFILDYRLITIWIYTYYIALIPSFFPLLEANKNNSYYFFSSMLIAVLWVISWNLPQEILFFSMLFNILILYISIWIWTKFNVRHDRFKNKSDDNNFIITQ